MKFKQLSLNASVFGLHQGQPPLVGMSREYSGRLIKNSRPTSSRYNNPSLLAEGDYLPMGDGLGMSVEEFPVGDDFLFGSFHRINYSSFSRSGEANSRPSATKREKKTRSTFLPFVVGTQIRSEKRGRERRTTRRITKPKYTYYLPQKREMKPLMKEARLLAWDDNLVPQYDIRLPLPKRDSMTDLNFAYRYLRNRQVKPDYNWKNGDDGLKIIKLAPNPDILSS